MSDAKLRSKLIRLAHEKPELREALLPILSGQKLAGRLVLGPERVDNSATAGLRAVKNLPAKSRGDLDSAVKSAAHYAKKLNEKMFVYSGNSYGSGVWRVSSKKSEYLDPINNTGEKVLVVTPDLTVSWSDVTRGAGGGGERTASRNDVIESILPMRDVAKLHHKMEEQDEQSARLLIDVYNALRARLSLSDGETEAMNRVTNMVKSGQNWNADLLRNNIFKAANSLGMKLPSAMF